jgi:hypothetical protein
MLILKILCITLEDMAPPISSVDSVIRRIVSIDLSSVYCCSEGGQTFPFPYHMLLLGNGHYSAVNSDGKLLWDFPCITRSYRVGRYSPRRRIRLKKLGRDATGELPSVTLRDWSFCHLFSSSGISWRLCK